MHLATGTGGPNYGWLDTTDIAQMFRFKSASHVRDAIRRGVFPIPVFKVGGQIFCDEEVVKAYLLEIQREGIRNVKASFANSDEDLE